MSTTAATTANLRVYIQLAKIKPADGKSRNVANIDRVEVSSSADVIDLRDAVKAKNANLLSAVDAAQLVVYANKDAFDAKEDPLDGDVPIVGLGSSKDDAVYVVAQPGRMQAHAEKQMIYKGMSVEATCRKFLDALAKNLAFNYKFDYRDTVPTIGDVLYAKQKNAWKFITRQKTLEERTSEDGFVTPPSKVPRLSTPLPEIFTEDEWEMLIEMNRKTNMRIHNAALPQSNGKNFVILPHEDFDPENINYVKKLAVKGGISATVDALIVKDENEFSGTSGSDASLN